ncbi:MAG TPA: sigma 54-interacting transcriptional regulator [Deltaproteobacteria bacterium]|nr:sigma 54-interacting transcriptional regulator [Deltaproteobacteria bacterium]
MKGLTTPGLQTLAILDAVPEPVDAEVLGKLSSLSPHEFGELVRKAVSRGLLVESPDGRLALSESLPLWVRRRISEINTKKHVASIIARIRRQGLQEDLRVSARISLLLKAGLDYDAALMAEEEAGRCVREGDKHGAIDLLEQAFAIVEAHEGEVQWDTLLITVVSELCRLRINVGRDLTGIPSLLELERPVAVRLGDSRTLARIDLVSGLYRYVTGDSAGGLSLISSGLQKAEELGDEDIMAISAEFRGIYYYLTGLYKEAADAFELVMRSGSLQTDKRAPTFLPEHLASSSALGYICALLGQYHRAVGLLDSHWRRARMNKSDRNACFYEALLGIVLIIMGRRAEAYTHLKAAQKEALEIDNKQAIHVAKKGLAYHAYFEGRIEDAYWITMNTPFTESIGPQYNWPVHLEMLYTFEKNELLAAMPTLAFEQEMERVLNGPNHHLRGVALRIRALQAQERGDNPDAVFSLLQSSEAELLPTGDPVELAKTRAEMARVKLSLKDRPAARNFALLAWEGLSGYGQDFFPDDLVPLLRIGVPQRQGHRRQEVLERFADLMDGFIPSADRDEILTRLVAATSRFFGAERGGLFWFAGSRDSSRPMLRASYNLDRLDVYAEPFREPLKLIFRTFRNAEPLVLKGIRTGESREGEGASLSVVCMPIIIKGESRGVLYLDSSIIEDGMEEVERDTVIRMARQASSSVERIFHYAETVEADRSRVVSFKSSGEGDEAAGTIIGSSPAMEALLALASQVAVSDATVLITGETGVGKELLARKIHDESARKDGPFIAVNPAVIPDTLVESELFGHEKGAFTGADRQKPGRVELAHTGTLFIDEIGDVPLNAQVKLLRVIQEKSFVRVGGIRTILSDFRLVAATNRDLLQDVASGKFRQDLYYRLNVVPLEMPPLRSRGEDVIELAREFLRHYSRKYHRILPDLSEEDVKALMAYPWPGNVRELKNVIERASILSSKDRLELNLPPPSAPGKGDSLAFPDTVTLDEIQRRYIRHVLGLTGGRIAGPGGAAELLGMKRTTLQARMKKLGLLRS